MKKIISLFQRDYEGNRLVRPEIVPGAEWVLLGEGVATRKWDGTCCLVRGGRLYKRYEVKPGGTPPANFEPANEVDENTGKQQGWVPVGDGPEDKYHREAFARTTSWIDWTYELVGPKVQGGVEDLDQHTLLPHGKEFLPNTPSHRQAMTKFNALREYFATREIEGIVWWRDPNDANCDKVKIKAKDFGLKRPTQSR
jgi:hypothetical protein